MYASSGRKTRTIDVLAKQSRRMPPKGHPPFLSIAHKGGDAGLTPCIHTALKFSCSGRQSSPWILFWDRTDGLSYEPDVVAAADQAWIEAHAERKSKVRIEGRRPIEAVGPEPVMGVVDLICNAENKKQLPVTLWAKLLTIQKITKFPTLFELESAAGFEFHDTHAASRPRNGSSLPWHQSSQYRLRQCKSWYPWGGPAIIRLSLFVSTAMI